MSSIKFQEHPTLFPQLHDPGLTTVTFHYNIYFFPYINVKEQEKNHNLLSVSHGAFKQQKNLSEHSAFTKTILEA